MHTMTASTRNRRFVHHVRDGETFITLERCCCDVSISVVGKIVINLLLANGKFRKILDITQLSITIVVIYDVGDEGLERALDTWPH